MRIKIKTWDEMKNEFGLDEQGDIYVKQRFTKQMERLMPKNRVINVSKNALKVYNWKTKYRDWNISEDMIEVCIKAYSIYGEHINVN